MQQQLIPEFEDFSSGIDLLKSIDSIHGFAIRAQMPKAARLDSKHPHLAWIAARLYRDIAEILETAGLQSIENLEMSGPGPVTAVSARYADPSFGFTVQIDNDLEIRIEREGSSLRLFHAWYRRLVPFFHGLVARIALDLTQALSMPFDLSPVKASFIFKLLFYDFCNIRNADLMKKNNEVIRPLLQGRPGPNGRLIDIDHLADEGLTSGRVDLSLSHFRHLPHVDNLLIREIYDIEAPANHDYRGLWMKFGAQVETPTGIGPATADQTMLEAPRPEMLLERYDVPYLTFFRDQVAGGFLTDIFENLLFKSTANYMS